MVFESTHAASFHIRQSEPFTCGPACLLMALHALGKIGGRPTRETELLLWRQANSVYMGEGPAGCGVYALGLAGLGYGCHVEIYTTKPAGHFDLTNDDPAKAAAARIIEDHDRRSFLTGGGHVHTYMGSFPVRLPERHACLALTGGDKAEDAHWVCLLPAADGYFLLDPETKGETSETAVALLSRAELHRELQFLGERAHIVVSP